MNVVIIIGKAKEIVKKENPAACQLLIEVEKEFREPDGNYLTEVFLVKIWRGLYDQIDEDKLLNKTLSIKGRLQQTTNNHALIIAESVSLIK